jgi:iron complex transport system ATP-binding protein
MSDAPLIDIHNATIFRGDTRVFENFSVRIEQREQVAILGPNGSGKTTLLKVINREIYPVRQDDSWVRILGREDWNVWELRRAVGIVSHDLQTRYRTNATGREVVLSGYLSSVGIHGGLARQLTAQQRSRAMAVLRELGIEDLADTALGKMSTGQQRRCLLGRALVHQPATLILDEPTAGLDLTASFDYLARLRRQIAGGKTVVLVTHMIKEIPPDISRLILLRAGRIIADGPKEEVLTVENLRKTYGCEVRITAIDGYYLAYPPDHR